MTRGCRAFHFSKQCPFYHLDSATVKNKQKRLGGRVLNRVLMHEKVMAWSKEGTVGRSEQGQC